MNPRAAKRPGEFRISDPPLPPGPEVPPRITAELHYLHALLIFSDAAPQTDAMTYNHLTGSARIEYHRDGSHWTLTIRENTPPGRQAL